MVNVQFDEVLGYPLATFYDEDGLLASSFYTLIGDFDLKDEATRFKSLIEASSEVTSKEIAAAIEGYNSGQPSLLHKLAKSKNSLHGGFYGLAQSALDQVAFGETITYRDLASLAGRPKAIRAAASACATNRLPFFRPCHRVIRSDGSLGGYLYGLEVKMALIDHEAKTANMTQIRN